MDPSTGQFVLQQKRNPVRQGACLRGKRNLRESGGEHRVWHPEMLLSSVGQRKLGIAQQDEGVRALGGVFLKRQHTPYERRVREEEQQRMLRLLQK